MRSRGIRFFLRRELLGKKEFNQEDRWIWTVTRKDRVRDRSTRISDVSVDKEISETKVIRCSNAAV